METSTDRIEREIVLQAPQSRVWRAISNAEEFGEWFGLDLKGKQFVPGEAVAGQIMFPGYEHLVCDMQIEQMVPERLFSYRWHPYAVDPAVDYSKEATTLVEFKLEAEGSGTRLRIVESGFDQIPASRREEAFRMNCEGWTGQIENIAKHVGAP